MLFSFQGISIGCSLLRLHLISTSTDLQKDKSWVIGIIFSEDLHNEMCTSGQNISFLVRYGPADTSGKEIST